MIVPTDVLYSDVENFEGGKLKYYYEHWKKYTSDTFILDIIKNGLKLDFNEIPFQHCCNNFPLSKEEMSIINSEIQKLKSKKVIVNTDRRTGDYIFDVFTRSKKDESPRMILNLENFNKFICYRLGPLFYRVLEIDKILVLKGHRRNYDGEIELSYQMKHAMNLFGGNITLKILFRI